MKQKKLLSLLLALCFVFAFAACGKSGTDTKVDEDTGVVNGAVAEEVKPVVAVEPVKPAEPVVAPVAKPVETKVAEPVEAKVAEPV